MAGILLSSPNAPPNGITSSTLGKDIPVYLHVLVWDILPLIVAFISTTFVLHAGLIFKEAKYVGVIKRGENKWEETLNEQIVARLGGRGNVEKVRTKSVHDAYRLDKSDEDRQFT